MLVVLPNAGANDSMPAAVTLVSAAPPQKADSGRQRGTLYRVRHQGNTSYLFGTIHFGKAGFFPLEAEVTRALAGASKLVIEVDVRDSASMQAAMNKHAFYAGADRLENHLSGASMTRLRHALQKLAIPFDQVTRMKPWMVANLVLAMDLERNGLQSAQGTEIFLLGVAQAQGKTILALESADYQLSLFDRMPQAQQENYLSEVLAGIEDGSALKKAAAMIDAWSNADSVAFDTILREAKDEKSAASDFIVRTLLDERNPEMANSIEILLRNDKSTFVAIGLLHLPGENGVPALLQRRGYEVTKLY
ncbi:MAG: TraB/GumN family protein [Pseudomonadota bacterium]